MVNYRMKKWFARFALVSGLYDLLLFIVFVFATPLLSVSLGIPVDVLSATLLQILGGCLLGFGIALVVASRDLDRLLIVPVIDIPARLIGGASVIYHIVLWGLPTALVSFGIVDVLIALVLLAFILGIKDYGIRAAFSRRRT
jgi:hypothetical protein